MTQPKRVMPSEIEPTASFDSQSDQHLIRGLKQRDPEAINQLWTNLYQDAVFVARKHRKSVDMGHDAAVQAFEQIMRTGIYNFRFNSSFRSYCWIILTRNLFRITKKERFTVDTELPEIPTADAKPIADADTIIERMRDCIENLKQKRYAAFELVDLQGKSPQVAADQLGISRNYANQLVSRARRDVRQCLEKQGYKSMDDLLSL